MRFFGRIVAASLFCAIPLALGACNTQGDAVSCTKINDDQKGAFMSRVADLPIPVRIDSAFSADERMQALQAIATWNNYGHQLTGDDFFVVAADNETMPEYVNSQNCASDVGGAVNTLLLVRSSKRTSPGRERVSSPSNAVGITFRCTLGDEAERQLTVIHADRVDPMQVQSVVLHELGHALGLDHSCDLGMGKPEFRSCTGLSPDHPYHLAVMYPTLQMRDPGAPATEVKDQLTQNDMDRMSCRYGSQ